MQPITKDRLSKYISLRKENENRLERLARLKSTAELPPMREADGSQHSGSSGDRMARAVEAYLEYQEQIGPILAANAREMAAIEQAVATLEDPLEREVLRLRYMMPSQDPETGADSCRLIMWSEIAAVLYGNPYERGVRMVLRLHNMALRNINSQ